MIIAPDRSAGVIVMNIIYAIVKLLNFLQL